MYTSLKIVKKLPYAWIYYPNGLTIGFAVSKGYFTAEEDTSIFQIVEQGKTKRPGVFLDNITLQDESTGGSIESFTSLAQLQQRLTELGNPLTQISSGTILTGDELAAIQNANEPSATNPFVTMEDVANSGVLADAILVSTGYTDVENTRTYNAGWVWRINGTEYSNPIAVVKTIPFAASGLSRFDKFAGNTSNTFLRIAGDESDTYIHEPDLLPNTVETGMVLVTDSTIDEVTPPMMGDIYVKKIESQDYIANYGTTLIIEQLDLYDDRSSISLINDATDVKSIQVSGEFIRPGKPHYFKNRTNHDVKLWHLAGTGNIKYYFPNEFDLIVKPNEVIEFNTNANDSSNVRFEFVGVITDLSDYYTKVEVDALVVGLWDDRGAYDASSNTYPSTGGSGISGAILKGDIWTISVPGILPTGQNVEIGDTVRALIDTPANTQSNWSILQNNIGYVAENSTNKSQDVETNKTSTTKFPSVKAVYDWAVGKFQSILVSGTNIKTVNGNSLLGAGDLVISGGGSGGIGGSGTVNKIAKWGTTSSLTDSLITDDGEQVLIQPFGSIGALSIFKVVAENNLAISAQSDSVYAITAMSNYVAMNASAPTAIQAIGDYLALQLYTNTGGVLIQGGIDPDITFTVNGNGQTIIHPNASGISLDVSVSPSDSTGLRISSDDFGNSNFIDFIRSSSSVFNINTNGDITTVGGITAAGSFFKSDLRLKDVIETDGDMITFRWKDGRNDKTHIGYIAQEVQKAMPDAVEEDSNGILSVNYIEVLVAKVRELEKEVELLKNKE